MSAPFDLILNLLSKVCFYIHIMSNFLNGLFYYHFSISENSISSLALNKTGDWLAIGCSLRGQLVVWEWQSESYIMKQQGHENAMSTLAYSHDGAMIVTGGEDGKVSHFYFSHSIKINFSSNVSPS